MPTYEYHCNTCGNDFEVFQNMSAEPLTLCPHDLCNQSEKGVGVVERKIGRGAGLIFSGSGFYQTDYKGSAGSASTSSTSSSTTKDSSKDSSSNSSATTSTSSSESSTSSSKE